MSKLNFCPDCGAELVSNARFCEECGFDTQSVATPASQRDEKQTVHPDPPLGTSYQEIAAPIAPQFPAGPAPQQADLGQYMPLGGSSQPLGTKAGGNKNALIIVVLALAVIFLGGGGLYWWLSRGEDQGKVTSRPSATQNKVSATNDMQPVTTNAATKVDLSRASTYLSEPGLKCTAFVNYPDGTAGVVERISARVVPNETVRVSEVETGVEQGEAFGYGFHYVERVDGTYYILDQTPDEIFPVLKNNLTVGQTWNYQDESGKITWKVVDMGVNLNLGFAVFENCLLVQEDNQAAGFQSITYYAPGRGIVLVRALGTGVDYYKLTALIRIDSAQAAAAVKQWSPNYYNIKDDRTQN